MTLQDPSAAQAELIVRLISWGLLPREGLSARPIVIYLAVIRHSYALPLSV